MSDKDLSRLERRIGYQFSDKNLLTLALTHRSFKGPNNERLEYLGDSILSFIIAEHLYQRFPKAKEGQMSRLRASLVKGVTLGKLGKEFELGDYLRLGAGELKSGGFRRESILADAVESILGAIYLDSSHEQCRKTVLQWYDSRLDGLTLEGTVKDPKTRLQEYLQSFKKTLPDYQVTEIKGEAHDQVFSVSCVLADDKIETKGSGSSRRFAEQEAAEAALKLLEVKVSD